MHNLQRMRDSYASYFNFSVPFISVLQPKMKVDTILYCLKIHLLGVAIVDFIELSRF